MKHTILIPALALGLVAGCSQLSGGDRNASVADEGDPSTLVVDDEDEGEDEEHVSLAKVPAAAKEAALAAVPGLVLEEAEKEGGDVYCLHGTANGTFFEVEVTASGEVVEIEEGDEDDGEEDDD